MSLTELKEQASRLSPSERLDLAAFLDELDAMNERSFEETVDLRMKAMDRGRKVTQEELEVKHARRLAKSRSGDTAGGS